MTIDAALPREKPALTILASNLASNSLGRALLLAEALKDQYRVRIVGPLRKGEGVWPVASLSPGIELESVRFHRLPLWILTALRVLRKIEGDRVVAVKPMASSFGIGLLAKVFRRKKLYLDIDDNELALLTEKKSFRQKYLHLNPDKLLITRWLDRRTGLADGISVASRSLQRKFGGVIVPHARDPKILRPVQAKAPLKKKLGVDADAYLIGYIGSYRRHKGLERIIEALDVLGDPRIRFLYTSGKDRLAARDYVRCIPEFPLSDLPDVLGACDLCVFPQVRSRISEDQLPAKMIDTIFMGIPFLVTRTENTASIVRDEEFLIDFETSAEELARRIRRFQEDPERAASRIRALRSMVLDELTLATAGMRLEALLET